MKVKIKRKLDGYTDRQKQPLAAPFYDGQRNKTLQLTYGELFGDAVTFSISIDWLKE